jgi:hypothetical protein
LKGLHAQLIDLVNNLHLGHMHPAEAGAVAKSIDALQVSSMMAVYAATSDAVQNEPWKQTPMPDKATLLPHQVRVVEEVEQLSERVEKLANFFDTDIYASLHVDEQQRLRRQLVYMIEYQVVLGERIAAFAAPTND